VSDFCGLLQFISNADSSIFEHMFKIEATKTNFMIPILQKLPPIASTSHSDVIIAVPDVITAVQKSLSIEEIGLFLTYIGLIVYTNRFANGLKLGAGGKSKIDLTAYQTQEMKIKENLSSSLRFGSVYC